MLHAGREPRFDRDNDFAVVVRKGRCEMTPEQRADKIVGAYQKYFEPEDAQFLNRLAKYIARQITEALAAQKEADAKKLEAMVVVGRAWSEDQKIAADALLAGAAAIRRTSEEKQDG
jgi:hypothetical protein